MGRCSCAHFYLHAYNWKCTQRNNFHRKPLLLFIWRLRHTPDRPVSPPPSFLSTWLYCNRIWWMKGISACLFPIWSSFRCWCSQLIFHTKKKQKTKKRLISQPCSVACLLEVSICLQYVNVPFSSLCGPSQSQEDRALFAEHVFYFILLLVRKCHVTPLCVTRYWNVNCVRVRETTEHAVTWRNLLEE